MKVKKGSKLLIGIVINSLLLFVFCIPVVFAGGGGGGGGSPPPPPTPPSLTEPSDNYFKCDAHSEVRFYGGKGYTSGDRGYECMQNGSTCSCTSSIDGGEGGYICPSGYPYLRDPPGCNYECQQECCECSQQSYTCYTYDCSPKYAVGASVNCENGEPKTFTIDDGKKATFRCGYSGRAAASLYCCKTGDRDSDKEACEEKGTYSWSDKVAVGKRCCGDDDPGDCNLVDDQNLCWNQGDLWNWMKAGDYPGKILDSGCNATCEEDPSTKTITNRTCIDSSQINYTFSDGTSYNYTCSNYCMHKSDGDYCYDECKNSICESADIGYKCCEKGKGIGTHLENGIFDDNFSECWSSCQSEGTSKQTGCGSKSVLSDGSKWISCTSSFYFQESPTGSTNYQKKKLTWSTSADFGDWTVPYINCESLHLDTYYADKKKAIYSNLNLPQNDYTLTFKSAGWNDGGCSRSYFGVTVYGEGDSVIYTESSTSRRPIDCFNNACVYPTGKTDTITFSGKPTKIEFEGSFTMEGSQWHGHLFIDSVTLSWSEPLNNQGGEYSQIQNPYKVTSDYLCSNGTIAECCGDLSCNSLVGGEAYGGVRKTTGAFFKLTNTTYNTTYYCADDMDWATDLDNKSQNSCEKAGFTGTGSKCCSEADDPNEYYNDNVSGCWNSSAVLSGDFPRNESDVVNYNGTFYGCKIDAKNYIDGNEGLLNIGDQHTGDPLINNTGYCHTLAGGYYYCAYTEKWTAGGEAQMKLSYVPWNETNTTNTTWREAGCCETDKCFNGTACIKTQINDTQNPGYKGYRCIDGEWSKARKVCTPDGDTCGYCPRNNQCLVNLQGNFQDNDNPNGNPQCISDGQYIKDDYCENGNWTSRTKWIALQLLDLATSDYALFCGNYEKVLNYLDYVVKDAKIARNYASETNNYCVLTHSGVVVFGTSLNNESDASKFDDVIGESCSSVTQEDGLYHPCSQSYRAWYNKKLKSAIYSKSQIQLSDSSGKFQQYLGIPFADLIKTLSQKVANPYDSSFINTTLKFRNLYVAEQSQKSVLGTIHGELYKTLGLRYLNFNTDVCKLAGEYNKSNSDIMSGIFCSKESNGYYVLAQGNIFTALDPANIWPDMTGKLRMS